MVMGARVRVELEHVGECVEIGLVGRVENETRVGGWGAEAGAVADEHRHPIVVMMEGMLNDLCM
ncbi:hypothetical protein HanIR_Chr03g0110611 [Helianthus annuus]|nr:hypothetical protein HanIR_Chr03g0110611 [Helianthus annuus]